ncbi:50S ribosomal protein L22 [Candidatus Bilamarchaeum dharawalense]|uniref:50S ribosomal protein L22 n=1 Tax=Candidatus Bilamarchaeum dharawalense TaxID=2885759 RepID=A0A5E4LLT9_9ARCH|nr:50S ribosomal protein L22 [Candidatus Bilamarchaeum dharawalense]
MKGYSFDIPENCAKARLEGVNASYKELAEVCGRIRNKKTDWAVDFLQQVAEGEIPVLFKRHNKNMGHRHELGGQKGRYPQKAAKFVLKTLQSAIANGKTLGLGDIYTILSASANKKEIYPRMASKGRQARSFLETARIEIVLKGDEIPKGVSVTPPKKSEAKSVEVKTETKPAVEKKEDKPEVTTPKKEEPKQHKHESEKKVEKKVPHQHAEYNKG